MNLASIDIADIIILQHSTLPITHLNESCDLVQLALCDDRAEAAVLLEGVANLDGLCTLLQARVELVGDALVHQQPGGCAADLPVGPEAAELRRENSFCTVKGNNLAHYNSSSTSAVQQQQLLLHGWRQDV
jgi:hypothetical protein